MAAAIDPGTVIVIKRVVSKAGLRSRSSQPRVYAAEREVFGDKFRGRDVGMALSDATELIGRYVQGWTVDRTAGGFGVRSTCWRHRKLIRLSTDAGLPIVLHELAHALFEGGHGLEFQRAYLDLVAKEMSPHWERRLRAAFIRHQTKGHNALRRSPVTHP